VNPPYKPPHCRKPVDELPKQANVKSEEMMEYYKSLINIALLY
jgi:hypothetical protein